MGPMGGWAGVLRKGPSDRPWPTASLYLLHPRPGFLGGLRAGVGHLSWVCQPSPR